jgi:hypothetical protein
VPEDQLALAIGKEGLNARLAARLTGWKVDIQSDVEFAQAEAEAAYAGAEGENEEFSGRCSAILSNGKRCPNAALPGTRYCGVPGHQELANREPEVPAEAPEEAPLVATEEEVEVLEPVARVEEVAPAPAGSAGGEPSPTEPAGPASVPERSAAGGGEIAQPAATAAPATEAAAPQPTDRMDDAPAGPEEVATEEPRQPIEPTAQAPAPEAASAGDDELGRSGGGGQPSAGRDEGEEAASRA